MMRKRPLGWITVAWFTWMVAGLMGLSRLPRLSWWVVAWLLATTGAGCCAIVLGIGRRRAFVEEHATELRDRRN